MAGFLRSWLAAAALAAVALGCALISGFGVGSAAAASCTPSPITNRMNVSVTPNADVRAFSNLKASFSGMISDGHCAGDSFSFAIPPTLTAQDGAVYPLKAPDGTLVATLTIHGRTATVTVTKYVETHNHVRLNGYFFARIDGSTAPGGTDNLQWDINGKSTTPVHMSGCPGCSSLPRRTTKNGAPASGGGLSIAVNTVASTSANQVFTFTDTLTSPGQRFDCPSTVTADLYSQRTAWGSPIITQRGLPVTVTSCSASALSGSVTIPQAGTAARINLHVTITDPSQASYSDTARVVTGGQSQEAETVVRSFGGGGSGVGDTPSASPSSTHRAPTSSGVAPTSESRTTTSSGVLPTAINGGGGTSSAGGTSTITGLGLLAAGLLGLALIGLRTGRLGGRGRHARH